MITHIKDLQTQPETHYKRMIAGSCNRLDNGREITMANVGGVSVAFAIHAVSRAIADEVLNEQGEDIALRTLDFLRLAVSNRKTA